MEGSYNKVFLAKGNIPAESYTFFIDILLDTIRCVGGNRGPVGFGKSLESRVRRPLVESHSGQCGLGRLATSVLLFYELELVMRL